MSAMANRDHDEELATGTEEEEYEEVSEAELQEIEAPAPVVDPTEGGKARRVQARVQALRVQLLRVAGRLGLRYDSDQVAQFMGVINRVEQVSGGILYKGTGRKLDLSKEAEKTARALDSAERADSRLDLTIKILLLGVSGTGKSALINALLGRPMAATSAFKESTRRVRVVRGYVHGIKLEFIDTPGLSAAGGRAAENRSTLKAIKAAYKWHKPNYVFWVDRLDSGRPAVGDLTLMGLVNEALGNGVWKETMVLLTHTHMCRAAMGPGYDGFSRQRRNIITQLLRQAASNQQLRNPMFLADCHPSCPTNSFGQPVIYEGATPVAWKQQLLLQLVGYRLYETAQALFRDALPKSKAAPLPKQADLMKAMMRPRLPPVSYYVEQLCEGVLAPDGWAAMEDPLDAGTEDLEAEEFEHAYYKTMYDLSCKGNPWAQKEYAAMLARQDRARHTYADAYKNEDIEQLAAAGYEGYVAEGLDLGPTFDPMQGTNHRYVYAVTDTDVQIMPTLDYYGWEHEDAISGFVAEWEGQPLNRHGWGGVPVNVTLAVEKDKRAACLQGEVSASLVHTVPPWGPRHITQVSGSFELLRPNIKDVLYQLELNSFKDGFLGRKDHAAMGLLVSRLGEKGSLTKGPLGFGLRLQDTFRLGAFKVEGSAAKCTTETAQGGRDVAWGARAFVRYDYLPGLGMLFDFYQQRTKEADPFQIAGTAANFTYDFSVANCACGVEVDYVPGQQSLHVDMNVFSGNSYRPAWLLLLPAFNYAKGLLAALRSQGDLEEEEGEGEEGEGEGEDMPAGMAGLTPEQQLQMMRMMGMAA